ncbi:MAG: adenylate/guanylate cyclase domain-containing protein [Acidimicrobiales bacterium]
MPEIWITLRTPNRRALTILVDAPLVVGRDCDGLILADQRVSRRHTSFEPTGGRLQVTDLGSSNGTTVNGNLITEPVLTGPGDLVTIGNTLISVQTREEGESPVAVLPTQLATPSTPSTKTSIELVAEAVGRDDTDNLVDAEVIGVEADPGTLTVVFSDIESSTELAVAMGDADWFSLLGQHHKLVSAQVEAHQGRIVKNQGDGYMLCFRSARQALLSCIGMQRDLERLGPSMMGGDGHAALRVRMGAHTGEVMMQDDGDLFGKHVIVAARIGALATGSQILVSSLVKQIAEPRGDIPFGAPYETKLKGIDGLAVIHDVDWSRYR